MITFVSSELKSDIERRDFVIDGRNGRFEENIERHYGIDVFVSKFDILFFIKLHAWIFVLVVNKTLFRPQ